MLITWGFSEAKAADVQGVACISNKEFEVIGSPFCQTINKREVTSCVSPDHLVESVGLRGITANFYHPLGVLEQSAETRRIRYLLCGLLTEGPGCERLHLPRGCLQ